MFSLLNAEDLYSLVIHTHLECYEGRQNHIMTYLRDISASFFKTHNGSLTS